MGRRKHDLHTCQIEPADTVRVWRGGRMIAELKRPSGPIR
jgi:hypothetical protein